MSKAYVVTALADTDTKRGWRSILLSATNEDEAVGKGLRLFEQREPDRVFSAAGALSVTKEDLLNVGVEL